MPAAFWVLQPVLATAVPELKCQCLKLPAKSQEWVLSKYYICIGLQFSTFNRPYIIYACTYWWYTIYYRYVKSHSLQRRVSLCPPVPTGRVSDPCFKFFWQMSLTWSTTTTARSTSTVSLADESHRTEKLSKQRNLLLFPWHDQVKGRSFVELSWQLLQINFLWVCRHHHVPSELKCSNPLEWFLPYKFIFQKIC